MLRPLRPDTRKITVPFAMREGGRAGVMSAITNAARMGMNGWRRLLSGNEPVDGRVMAVYGEDSVDVWYRVAGPDEEMPGGGGVLGG